MKELLNKLTPEFQDLIRLAGRVASLRRMSVYLVGGFVRDLMLGVKNLDLDIVVEGDGIIFAEDFAARLNSRLIRHKRFGTATIICGPHLKIDIATARKEIYLKPAALPTVEFGALKDDLKRRDFTINAMAVNLNQPDFGCLIDFFKGKADLDNKRIRILHEISFIDDPTRILRAVRFEKRYGFKIEPLTLRCLKEAVKGGMLQMVQPQRLRDELIMILKESHPVIQIERLQKLMNLDFINPRIKLGSRHYGLLKSVEKEITWFNRVHSRHRKLEAWLIYFMALTDQLTAKQIYTVSKKFAFSRGEEKRIMSLKKIGKSFISRLSHKTIKASRIFRLLEPLSYEVILLLKSKYKNPCFKKHIEDFLEIYSGMRIYISGHHLKGMGVAPGPHYQKIFAKVLEAKLNGLVKTEEEELSFIRKLIERNCFGGTTAKIA